MNISYFKNRPLLTIFLLILLAVFTDLSNLDSLLHKGLCTLFGKVFSAVCPDYYDLPIWEVGVSFGTVAAALFAYKAIIESNRRLEIEQTPYVVLKERVYTAGSGRSEHLHIISLKNVGKASAVRIIATTDPEGEISIIEGSNPHSIDLAPAEPHNNWAIDEQRVIEGLAKQGKIVRSVVRDIPDENTLRVDQKDKADFNLFIWYENQQGNRYQTIVKIRHSGVFFKVMENKFEKI